MGDFVLNVAVAYQVGASRGDYSIFSAMDIDGHELFAAFGRSINDLILCHRKALDAKRQTRRAELKLDPRWLEAASSAAGPKQRWVDGTPEYSFHICGLRKLFPRALFIHLFRDVQAVVHSMVNFHRVTGIQLVANEEDAYRYWIRTVSACVQAERAFGPGVVHRLRYADLVDNPESTIRSLLDFLGEPYTAKCLEPLAHRINSSCVQAHLKSADSVTDPVVVRKARRLLTEVEKTPQPGKASSPAADEMEAGFRKRVKYMATIDSEYQKARCVIEKLNKPGLPLQPSPEALPAIEDPSAALLSRQP
jgi:hypothetical protein